MNSRISDQKFGFYLCVALIGFVLAISSGLIVYNKFGIPTSPKDAISSTKDLPPPNCVKCEAPTFPIPEKIPRLSLDNMKNTKPIDLLNVYEPNTYGRLQVALQLVEFGVEWWADAFTLRNCINDKRRVCTICKDRYDYLRCIVENRLYENTMNVNIPTFWDRERGIPIPNNSNNNNYLFTYSHGNEDRSWVPADIRRRAMHAASKQQFIGYNEFNNNEWEWKSGLRYEDYLPLLINQRALSFYIQRRGNTDEHGLASRKDCIPCRDITRENIINHMNCTAWPHWLYEPPNKTEARRFRYNWWPPFQL